MLAPPFLDQTTVPQTPWVIRHARRSPEAPRAAAGWLVIAITRGIPSSFRDALAEVPRRIDVTKARRQHARYVQALDDVCERVIVLPPDEAHPDCPFVEDQAVVVGQRAVITRAGHPSRRGEAGAVHQALSELGLECHVMAPHATLDGGDVMLAAGVLYVGRSARTNGEGMGFLARTLGLPVVPVPVGGLHLKSVCSAPDERLVLVAADTVDPAQFAGCSVIVVPPGEARAANAVGVGRTILLVSGCPQTRSELEARGRTVVELGVGELAKADGALTCLSLLVP